jgi:hypothetical protein
LKTKKLRKKRKKKRFKKGKTCFKRSLKKHDIASNKYYFHITTILTKGKRVEH